MVFSPINMVPKPNGKKRLILNLAYPHDGISSVNTCIPPENSKVQYHSIDDVIQIALVLGKDTCASWVDILHPFMNLGIHPDDIPVLGFTLNGKYYIYASMPFGAASSCLIFERVASLLEWVVAAHTGRDTLSHYLDDFSLLAQNMREAIQFNQEFITLTEQIGFPIAHHKTIGPDYIIEYLGLLLNFRDQVLGIPEDKRIKYLERVQKLISAHRNREFVTVKDIEKLTGQLNFICQAILAGRTFLSQLYSLCTPATPRKKVKSGHRRHITKEIHDDMVMFQDFLEEMAPQKNRSIPFMQRLEIDNDQMELFADASGHPAKAAACYYNNQWVQGFWSETDLFDLDYHPNIALLELLAICMAGEIWAPQLSAKTITLWSDNQATCAWLTRKRCDIPVAMNLLGHLTKTCLLFQIHIKAKYIRTTDNTFSDLISRDHLDEFHALHPVAD